MNLIKILESGTTNMPFSVSQEQGSIFQLQAFLRELAFAYDSIPLIVPDGIFGAQTTQALIQFQLLKGLPPTGVADYRTWTMLTANYIDILQKRHRPPSCLLFPISQPKITVGDKGNTVYFIQIMLQTLSHCYENLPQAEVNGVYDQQTQQAVSCFQKIESLEVTGDVDDATWNQLVCAYSCAQTREGLVFRPKKEEE